MIKDVPPATPPRSRLPRRAARLGRERRTPSLRSTNRVFPCPVRPFAETEPHGYREQWVCYGTGWYSAKELTVLPKRTVTIKDCAAYGLIVDAGPRHVRHAPRVDARR